MTGERARYRNPVTNIIQYESDALVAELLGLEPWDGDVLETEKDKVSGIEIAVLPVAEDVESSTSNLRSTTTEVRKPAGKSAAGDKK